MKKILTIAFVCGIFSLTTMAQSAQKPSVATANNTEKKAETKHSSKSCCSMNAEASKECKDKGKSAAECHDKKAAGKSSCCMSGKTEAKAEGKDAKKAEKE